MPPTSPALAGTHGAPTHEEPSPSLRATGGTAVAAGLAGLVAACGGKDKPKAAENDGPTAKEVFGQGAGGDVDIANYALALEYLEATFYAELVESGKIKDAATLGLIKSIGRTERKHVDALTATVKELGGTPVKRARTAFGPVMERGTEKILAVAATVENVGAAAYLGQVDKIKSTKLLAAALAIHSVEARHAAALNQLAGRDFKGAGILDGTIPDGAFAVSLSTEEVFAQIKPFLAR